MALATGTPAKIRDGKLVAQGVGARKYIGGTEEVLKAFEQMTEAAERRIAKQVEVSARDVARLAKKAIKEDAYDTGILYRSISLKKINKTLWVVFAAAADKYDAIAANVVEFGRTNHPYPLEAKHPLMGATALVGKHHARAIRRIIKEEKQKRFGK